MLTSSEQMKHLSFVSYWKGETYRELFPLLKLFSLKLVSWFTVRDMK